MITKKSLGQHFLKSNKALRTIIEAGKVYQNNTIIEIGPGTGVLTEKLLETGAKVIAVEKDDNLFKLLEQKFEKEIINRKLELIHGDILEFNLAKLATKTYKLIANIPYNITGGILKKFLETHRQPEKIVLLVQKEVAERIIARNNKESILSISVKAYGTPEYIETVKAGSFVPAPKVDSDIIAIGNISKNFFQSASWRISEKEFFEIVRSGFKSKRKKLSSNLATMFPKDNVQKIFQKINLDDNIRAEDVKTETWKKLATLLLGSPTSK